MDGSPCHQGQGTDNGHLCASAPYRSLSLHRQKTCKGIEVTKYDLIDPTKSLYYPACIGVKTGYTNAAGKCPISCGAYNNTAVVVVVLGSTGSKVWGESLKYLKWALGIA